MKTVVKVEYVAFDGTRFHDEEACQAYEDACQRIAGVIAFNNMEHVVSDAETVAYEATYYFITSESDADRTLGVLKDLYGTEFPTVFSNGDLFRYDFDKDCWKDMVSEFCDLGYKLARIGDHVKQSARNDEFAKNAWAVVRERISNCNNIVTEVFDENI